MRRPLPLVAVALAAVSCSADGDTESGTFVGSLRFNGDGVGVEARCRDGNATTVEVGGLKLGNAATVELPRGDFASGGGTVEVVPSATVEDVRWADQAHTFQWRVEVDDDWIVRIAPWFVETCVE